MLTCTQLFPFFTFSSTKQTRGHSRILDKSRVSSVCDAHSFSNVNVWNSLPEPIVMSRLNLLGTLDIKTIKLHFCD